MDSAHVNSVFFQEYKPYVSQYQYEKGSLIANVVCIIILLIFIYYFFYIMSSKYNKNNLKKNVN